MKNMTPRIRPLCRVTVPGAPERLWTVDYSRILLRGPPRLDRQALDMLLERPSAIAECFPRSLRDHIAEGGSITLEIEDANRTFLARLGGPEGYRQWLCLAREGVRLLNVIRRDRATLQALRGAPWHALPPGPDAPVRDEHGTRDTHAALTRHAIWRDTVHAGWDRELPAFVLEPHDSAETEPRGFVARDPEATRAAVESQLRRRITRRIAEIRALPTAWRQPSLGLHDAIERAVLRGIELRHDWRDDSVSWGQIDPDRPGEIVEHGPYLTLELAVEASAEDTDPKDTIA
jgi:hypothetical protein